MNTSAERPRPSGKAFQKTWPSFAFSALVALVVIVVGITLDHQNTSAYRHELQLRTANEADLIRARVAAQISINVSLVRDLANIISITPALRDEDIAHQVDSVLVQNPQLLSVALAPHFIIGSVFPAANNEERLGHDLRETMLRQQASVHDKQGFAARFYGPILTPAGRQAFAVIFPVFVNDGVQRRLWGGVEALIDSRQFYEATGLKAARNSRNEEKYPQIDHLSIAMRDLGSMSGAAMVPFLGEKSVLANEPARRTISFPGGKWELAVVPKTDWSAPPDNQFGLRLIIIIAGFTVVIPVFFSTMLLVERNNNILALEAREAKLLELSRRLNLALESSNIGIWELHHDGIVEWDAQATALHGARALAPGERHFSNQLAFVQPEDRDIAVTHIFGANQTGGSHNAQYRVVDTDGGLRWLRSVRAFYEDGSGRYKTIGVVWDVTADMTLAETLRNAKSQSDLKNAELELVLDEISLREQQLEGLSQKLELALDANHCGIWDAVIGDNKSNWDCRMHELYGLPYTSGVISNAVWLSCIHPEERADCLSLTETLTAVGQSGATVRRVLRPDGSDRFIRTVGKLHETKDGGRRLVGIAFDVTEDALLTEQLKSAKDEAIAKNVELELVLDEISLREQQLEGLSQKLDLALDANQCGIWENIVGQDVANWDKRMHQLYGLSFSDGKVSNAEWLNAIHPDQRDGSISFVKTLKTVGDSGATVRRVLLPDGSVRFVRTVGKLHEGMDGERRVVGIAFDVTEDAILSAQMKAAKDDAVAKNVELELAKSRIEHNSLHDPLTALANRRKLDLALERLTKDSASEHQAFAILHIDLDRFKDINDTLGHAAGDAMLVHVSKVLAKSIRGSDIVARIGGDEFVIVAKDAGDATAMAALAGRIIEETRQPIDFQGFTCRCGVSIGIALANGRDIDARAVLINADIALYRAKSLGRNRYEFFSHKLQAEVVNTKHTADAILAGLENDEFTAWYQPQFSARTMELTGVEALVRWNHPTRGVLAPDQFLRIAEDINVVQTLDRIVLETALKDKMRWAARGIRVPKISVNVSSRRLHDNSLIESLEGLQIMPGEISFELVESIFLDESEDVVSQNIERIKALGIDIEIDDFGTGHTSIVSLLRLKPKRLKIDRQLVMPILTSPHERALVRSIVEIARSLGIETVAEGVETLEHAARLRELGCDLLQGYAFARPLSFEAFSEAATETDWRRTG